MASLGDVYDREGEQRRLAALLFPRYARMLLAVHKLVASLFPEWQAGPEDDPWRRGPDDAPGRLDDPAVRKQLALAAEQVVLIDGATRDALRDVLREGQRRGYSAFEVAHGVAKDGYGGIDGLYLHTWAGRSETIARTELATASNAAALGRYAATGRVSRVRIHENRDTDAPCAARNRQGGPLGGKPEVVQPNRRRERAPC